MADIHLPDLGEIDLPGRGDRPHGSELIVTLRLMLFVTIGTAYQGSLRASLGHHFAIFEACVHVAGHGTLFPRGVYRRHICSRLGSG